MNKYPTSTGERISQATIDRRRSAAYKKYYGELGYVPNCAGCGGQIQGTAHIIPQSVCKHEGMAEYCYLPINFLPACHACNSIIEAYKGEAFKKLKCYQLVLDITKKILPSRWLKMTNL